jgi:hypothetical protein
VSADYYVRQLRDEVFTVHNPDGSVLSVTESVTVHLATTVVSVDPADYDHTVEKINNGRTTRRMLIESVRLHYTRKATGAENVESVLWTTSTASATGRPLRTNGTRGTARGHFSWWGERAVESPMPEALATLVGHIDASYGVTR